MKERKVFNVEGKKLDFAELEDVTLESYTNHAKNGTLDQIENELELLGGIQAIVPQNMAHLSEKEFIMCMLMYSNDVYCEYTNKKTQGDIVSSFIMTFENGDDKFSKHIQYLVKNSFSIKRSVVKASEKTVSGSKDNSEETNIEYKESYAISNMANYIRLKSHALSFWNKNNLKQYKKLVTDLLNGGISEIERFEDKVFDEAMNNEDASIRARYASIYSKNKGLDKSKGTNIVNMFHYGGAETIEQLANVSGNSRLSIKDVLEADSFSEIENIGDDDE